MDLTLQPNALPRASIPVSRPPAAPAAKVSFAARWVDRLARWYGPVAAMSAYK